MMDAPIPTHFYDLWKDFFKSVQPNSNGYELAERLFSTELMALQRLEELEEVIDFVRNRVHVETYMEIGADRCTTLFLWCFFNNPKKVIACEHRGTPFADLFEMFFPDIQFLWLPVSSYSDAAIAKVSGFLGDDKISCLFIDGDKDAFEKDFNNYKKFVNGYVLFHDVFDDGSPMQKAFRLCSQPYSEKGVWVNMESCDRLKEELILDPKKSLNSYETWLTHWMYSSCGYGWLDTRSLK